MNGKLDLTLSGLKAESAWPQLKGLEPAVWRRIDHVRMRGLSRSFLPARIGAVVGALMIGVVGGTYAAAAAVSEKHEISAFSIDAHLAPSTLLDGQR